MLKKTGAESYANKSSDVYKSTDLNYSSSSDNKDSMTYMSYNNSGSAKANFSNHNLDIQNTITANVAFSYSFMSESSSINISAAEFKIAADDKSSLWSLSFTGIFTDIFTDVMKTNSINLKSLTLETADLKFVSGGVKSDISTEDYLAVLENISMSSSIDTDVFTEENINSSIAIFQGFNQGDNTITIKNVDGASVDGGNGADTIIGGSGNDGITGGAGSDKLTGGKGVDKFSFSGSDFFTENSKGDVVFNKSVDTTADFNLKDGDILDLGDLGELGFYTLAQAKIVGASLFYDKGVVYLNISLTDDKYIPTPIIKLTGNPAVNADETDFDYPI